MKIYTKRGDRGETDLLGGSRVGKDDPRVDAYGVVDELNAAIGLARAHSQHSDLREWIVEIQSSLLDLGSLLATPEAAHRQKMGLRNVSRAEIEALEGWIDRAEEELEPLATFILPGGTPSAAAFHVARTLCRRAERRVVALDREQTLDAEILGYLNRLSDLLFTLARIENHRAGVTDIAWVGRER